MTDGRSFVIDWCCARLCSGWCDFSSTLAIGLPAAPVVRWHSPGQWSVRRVEARRGVMKRKKVCRSVVYPSDRVGSASGVAVAGVLVSRRPHSCKRVRSCLWFERNEPHWWGRWCRGRVFRVPVVPRGDAARGRQECCVSDVPRTSGRLSGVWLSCGEESSQCAARCRAWDSPVAAAYDADVSLPG